MSTGGKGEDGEGQGNAQSGTEGPRRQGVPLGRLDHCVAGEPGYFCVVMTHDRDALDDGRSFRVHVMRAAGLDRPWREHETHTHLSSGAANHLFTERENLAEWPEGK